MPTLLAPRYEHSMHDPDMRFRKGIALNLEGFASISILGTFMGLNSCRFSSTKRSA